MQTNRGEKWWVCVTSTVVADVDGPSPLLCGYYMSTRTVALTSRSQCHRLLNLQSLRQECRQLHLLPLRLARRPRPPPLMSASMPTQE
jgi:hypothetical protein